jgi:peptide subunit release factor 1 (eRF1)
MDPKRYLVILADRQRGRFFTIFADTFEDEGEQIFDEVPQKVRAEHTRPGHVQQHIRDHLHRHLKRVGLSAKDFLIKRKIRKIDGILLGGHQELLNSLEKFLPPKLRLKVIGKFVTDVSLSVAEITEKVNAEIKELSEPTFPQKDFYLRNQRVR